MAVSKQEKTTTEKTVVKKKTTSMRESAAKSRAHAEKPRRVRKAASIAKKPVDSVSAALKKEYHLVQPKNGGSFFTKSRKLTPGYFRSAWSELRQVTWPRRKETWRLVFAVFMFAIVVGTVIAVLDYGLEKLLRTIIF